jgi:cytochrome c553
VPFVVADLGVGVVVYELNDADMQALAHYMATRP